MHQKFEINQTKIKGGCQPGRKVVTQNSKSDLPPSKLHVKIATADENQLLSDFRYYME